jgi:hypothetical protein
MRSGEGILNAHSERGALLDEGGKVVEDGHRGLSLSLSIMK